MKTPRFASLPTAWTAKTGVRKSPSTGVDSQNRSPFGPSTGVDSQNRSLFGPSTGVDSANRSPLKPSTGVDSMKS